MQPAHIRPAPYSRGTALWLPAAFVGAGAIPRTFDIPKGRPQNDWSRHTERPRWQVSAVLDKRNPSEFEVPVFL